MYGGHFVITIIFEFSWHQRSSKWNYNWYYSKVIVYTSNIIQYSTIIHNHEKVTKNYCKRLIKNKQTTHDPKTPLMARDSRVMRFYESREPTSHASGLTCNGGERETWISAKWKHKATHSLNNNTRLFITGHVLPPPQRPSRVHADGRPVNPGREGPVLCALGGSGFRSESVLANEMLIMYKTSMHSYTNKSWFVIPTLYMHVYMCECACCVNNK